MVITISGKKVTLDPAAVVGVGGEATVFALPGDRVAKIWHQPTREHATKLDALEALGPLTSDVVAPIDRAFDAKGKRLVGCVQRRVPSSLVPLGTILKRTGRESLGLGVANVVELLLRLARDVDVLHARGAVVGDLNDQNVLVQKGELALIDVDSLQLPGIPCTVATEAYLDPALYDRDLAAGPCFSRETDRWALATMAFRALLFVHPFGGVHPKLRTIADRAKAGVWALATGVTYPAKVALPPAILSPELRDWFEGVFVGGRRDALPTAEFQAFAASVSRCGSCGLEAPRSLASCPACATKRPVPPRPKGGGCVADRLLVADGPIVRVVVAGQHVHAFAIEAGTTVHYLLGSGPPRRTVLGTHEPLERWAVLAGDRIARATSKELTVLGPDGRVAASLSTERFDGAPVVAGSGDCLLRIAGGLVLRGFFRGSAVVERPLGAALEEQTFVTSSPSLPDVVVGLDRVFRHVSAFRIARGARTDLALPKLPDGEALRAIELLPDATSTLVLRETEEGGVGFVRLDLLDARGALAASSKVRQAADPTRLHVRGRAFRGTTVLHPTDDGVVREHVVHGGVGALETIGGTEPFVSSESQLAPHPLGLLVAEGREVVLLSLS